MRSIVCAAMGGLTGSVRSVVCAIADGMYGSMKIENMYGLFSCFRSRKAALWRLVWIS